MQTVSFLPPQKKADQKADVTISHKLFYASGPFTFPRFFNICSCLKAEIFESHVKNCTLGAPTNPTLSGCPDWKTHMETNQKKNALWKPTHHKKILNHLVLPI